MHGSFYMSVSRMGNETEGFFLVFAKNFLYTAKPFGVSLKINGGKTKINVISLNCFCPLWLI